MELTILMFVAIGVVFYFLMIRPARKQQKKQQEMMNSLGEGQRVMLGSGIYGTIRHLGEKQAVIEISPGVDLTVLRAAIRGAVSPDEEEFEYADETEVQPPAHDMTVFEADVASPFAPEEPAEPAEPEDDATPDKQ